MKMKLILPIFLLTSLCSASENIYKLSIATLAAGNIMDAQSSYGKLELNPVLKTQGKFGIQSIAIKSGITFGILMLEKHGINKIRGGRKISTIINFAIGGATAAVAIQNHRGGF